MFGDVRNDNTLTPSHVPDNNARGTGGDARVTFGDVPPEAFAPDAAAVLHAQGQRDTDTARIRGEERDTANADHSDRAPTFPWLQLQQALDHQRQLQLQQQRKQQQLRAPEQPYTHHVHAQQ